MMRAQVVSTVGEMPQSLAVGVSASVARIGAPLRPEGGALLARPRKKKGGCQTCDGRGCVGRCKF